jgi:hypothetical protein
MRPKFLARFLLLSVAAAMPCANAVAAQQPEQKPDARPQAQPQNPPQMPQNPRVGPEHRRLAFLLGAWEEKVTYPGETEKDGSGRWFARPALGMYLHINYEGSGPQGNYRALGILTWDREQQTYRMWWFDDGGGIGEYRGSFTEENSLSLEHHGKVDGRDFRERITYTRITPTQVNTKIEQAWGTGEFKTYLEATANRTGDAPPPGQGQPRRPQQDRPQRP